MHINKTISNTTYKYRLNHKLAKYIYKNYHTINDSNIYFITVSVYREISPLPQMLVDNNCKVGQANS